MACAMPSKQNNDQGRPAGVAQNISSIFSFPDKLHLLITTPSRVFTWDRDGVQTAFKSSKRGIVNARESKDASGLLAIANKHVVVLHDTKCRQERSWGFESADDEVRHLEYSVDSKTLFLSTRLTNDIHCYSIERERLLVPVVAHAQPPIALAISSTGQWMVSASDDPPAVYLKNLRLNTAPVSIPIRTSESAVCVVAFHPERPNIFLLGFKNGVIAAFDAQRIGRNRDRSVFSQNSIHSGEIGCLSNVHHPNLGSRSGASITGAAFLPGYSTRAVSVGGDGRCRLIDFTNGGEILRSWHAKAPITSVSVTTLKNKEEHPGRSAGRRQSHLISGPTGTNNIIAIGRADGYVQLYDSIGILLVQNLIEFNGDKILNVEWAQDVSPRPLAESSRVQMFSDQPSKSPTRLEQAKMRRDTGVALPHVVERPNSETSRSHRLRSKVASPQRDQLSCKHTIWTPRKFTIHPDEVEESTMRHMPSPMKAIGPAMSRTNYSKIFSPTERTDEEVNKVLDPHISSPMRSRPRISSQTFLEHPRPMSNFRGAIIASPRNLTLFPSTDTAAEGSRPRSSRTTLQRKSGPSPSRPNQITCFKEPDKPSGIKGRARRVSSGKVSTMMLKNNNAQNWRKTSAPSASQRKRRLLSICNRTRPRPIAAASDAAFCMRRGPDALHRRIDHIDVGSDSDDGRRTYEAVQKERHNWPIDSNQASSVGAAAAENDNEDIWITSNSDGTIVHRHRPRNQKPNGTKHDATATRRQVLFQTIGGSTEDDNTHEATTHILADDGTFSPSSKDISRLFPRSSSVSPRKSKANDRSISPTSLDAPRRPPPGIDQRLHEMGPSSSKVAGTNVIGANKTSWTQASRSDRVRRVHQSKDMAASRERDGAEGGHPDVSSSATSCGNCRYAVTRAYMLEGEIARLKDEMLVLKSLCRRSGVLG